MKKISLVISFFALIILSFVALFIGKYTLNFSNYLEIFSAKDAFANVIIAEIRFPRIAAAILVGAALSVSGAVYQAMFVNPLVSPGVLGVLSGASFGAALGMILGLSVYSMQILIFVFGVSAVAIAVLISMISQTSRVLMLILGGIVSGAIFTSLSSVIKYFADPNEVLPNIVYFLMGSLSFAQKNSVFAVSGIILICIFVSIIFAKQLNALSLGDEEAKSLGINTKNLKIILIVSSTLSSSLCVMLAGVIGWIGLVVPHICRFFYGSDNRYVIVASAIFGAIFLLVCDTVAKELYTYEIPLGLITSLFGIPIFIAALFKVRGVV